MALRREYDHEVCPVARSLEVIGERWTLLIIRDAFYGVVRFTDFRDHLEIPPAVLTERLRLLVEHQIMTTSVGTSGRSEYSLTRKGELLWPVVWSMMNWGNEFYVESGLRRPIVHSGCGGELTPLGNCGKCGIVPAPRDLDVHPRRSRDAGHDDRISRLLRKPHRMLEPFVDTP
ncbi:winged helix-turn-helix transcriptional regulator [Mycobacterium montefiorense]|uniref:winged helix-turn-helix transcriptional regulator n=2 Tax=Mycobacterium montefiorense TaxID=154654 RepID=UPI0021F2D26A|nr:helix-turn-helix domain-containing protein [Mycobacterium montefiorense]MCV7426350.1 helix-turn-helix transcriptional regulator [Mycobacterium montefiorense]